MIIAHRRQWQFLKKVAELEKVPHALLFYGNDSLGAKSMALDFVKLLNPEIKKETHPDLTVIEPPRKEIPIAQIRDLHSKLALRAYSAPFKSVIIDNAHLLNQEAQSAFLKLLEEPKGKSLFILITQYPEMLLPTILSRVERLRFYSAPETVDLQEKRVKEILQMSHSSLGTRFQYAKELSQEPQNLKEILDIWLRYFRSVLLSDPRQKKIIRILNTLQTINFLLSTTNVNPRLALEILMLEL